jgi:hypothetical protein
MAVPTAPTLSAAAKVALNAEMIALIDADDPAAGLIRIRDADDVLLAEMTLDLPCGTVDGGTGVLTLAIAAQEASAPDSGTAAYAEYCDSSGNAILSLPCQAGAAPVAGYLVLNTLTIVATGAVTIVSATIG